MKSIFITSLLIAMAAVCNAIMDTLDDHFCQSVFANWGAWWAGGVAYSSSEWYFLKPLVYDGWHCFKQLMILCFLIAIIKYKPSMQYLLSKWVWYHWKERYAILITKYKYIVSFINFLIYWGLWSGVHKLFYQVILI